MAGPVVLDQSVLVSDDPRAYGVGGISSESARAQTFTVGINGRLEFASAALFSQDTIACLSSPIDCNLEMRLTRTALGAPSDDPNDLLATVSVPWVSIPSNSHGYKVPNANEYTVFDLRHFNIAVSAGDVFAMVFLSTIRDTAFGTFNSVSGVIGEPGTLDPNPGGQQWFKNPSAGLFDWTPANRNTARFVETGFQTFVSVPEPGTLGLFGLGLVCLGVFWRKNTCVRCVG